ncbi:MAG: 4-hydroxybenzoyl-CoA thioesterase family active site [Planctomycetaceae bacterium]|nr:4-hydroxybenzoyl-CoA thioesterase family active site [Planctomycetaceae bacterium]
MLTEHEIQFRVRYKETDAMGYVHHANYATFFEMGRTELLRADGGNYRIMEEAGLFLVVVRLNTHFRAPARYDDWLTLKTRIKRVGAAKLEHEYFLYRDGQLLSQAESVLACVDRSGKVQPIPEALRIDAEK